MNEKQSTKPQKPKTVAEYIDWQLSISEKRQFQVAEDSGFDKPNIITMIKQGKTKLPLEKIGRFAKAIGVDPVHLFKMCIKEYYPETSAEIEQMFGQPILTKNELDILEAIRSANVENPRLRTDAERQRLVSFVNNLKGENEAKPYEPTENSGKGS
jgi:hypothetical protein